MKVHKETDQFIIYKIAHLFKYNPRLESRTNSGKTIIATQWKDKTYKINFNVLNYHLNGKTAQGNPGPRFCLSCKNGRLILYRIIKNNGGNHLHNVSCSVNLFSQLYLNKKEHAKKLARVINQFLKQNNVNRKLPIQKIDQNNFGEHFCHLLYPGAKGVLTSITKDLSKFFREKQPIKNVIKGIFGFNGKKITKLVCQQAKDRPLKLEQIFYFGLLFKGMLPIDYFYPLFEREFSYITWHRNDISYKDVRKFLKERTETQKISLFNDLIDLKRSVVLDTLRGHKQHPQEYSNDLRTWQDFHDVLYPTRHRVGYNTYNPEPEKEIIFEYSVKWKEINDAVVDDMRIILPATSFTLCEWSDKMSNCVRGYSTVIEKGYSKVLGVMKANELKYNIEIRGKEITQFYGKCNSVPNSDDQEKITNYLKENKYIEPFKNTVANFGNLELETVF